jgi:hypothetical protein
MKISFLTVIGGLFLAAQSAHSAAQADTRFFELRTYYAAPGKLDALQARFREHTLKLFEKHGLQNIGYWLPVTNSENKLIYLLASPTREAREQSWKAFFADPEWQQVQKASETNGKLVAKVDSIYLKATEYSPAIEPNRKAELRLFELRTYTAAPGKLSALNQRFRDTTVGLFAQYGIVSIGYWTPADKDKGSDNTLIYIVAHPNQAGADADWKAFREDPAWVNAKRRSEADGPLTVTNGVKSVYMTPADYSPIR